MREVRDAKCIQILITNKCCFSCANCSELCGHMPAEKRYDMTLEDFENAVKTLVDFPGHVGIFGGEPTLHPNFGSILEILRKYVWVKARRELWTSGAMWDKWKTEIEETFYPELISFNDHSDSQICFHQPNNIGAREVFNGLVTSNPGKDAQLMWRCIDNCWIANRWSPIINSMGCFFCETAGARATLLGGPVGLPVEPGWWRRPMGDYGHQMEHLCVRCSACLPMPMKANSYQGFDDISPDNQALYGMVGSPKVREGHSQIADLATLREFYKDHTFTPNPDYLMRGSFLDFPEWTPWMYRPETKNLPDGTERSVADVAKEQVVGTATHEAEAAKKGN